MSRRPDLFISTSMQDKEAVDKLNRLFADAAVNNIEDVQLRFEGDVLRIQYVNQSITDVDEVEGATAKKMVERLKSRASISATEFMEPKEGRLHLNYTKAAGWPLDRRLDLRVNVIPTDAGETFCIRLLAKMGSNLSLQHIDMTSTVRHEFNTLLREQQGIFIVCGPVGSGKTTLLFSLLNELRLKGKNIKTIEDPVEIVMPGIDQMQVSHKLSFADGIRAMLRQRVHVGLVGEVRDHETAETAFRAGNTGTLLFFTLHADDAAMVVSRCEDLGIDRETFAQSVKLIVFTRLIRKLPDGHEFTPVKPSDSSRHWLEEAALYDPNDRFVEAPDSAFQGKMPLFEMIKITPEMRRVITSTKDPRLIREAAAKQPQYETLAEYAVRVARQGRTSLSQVQDLIGETVHPVVSARLDKKLYKAGILSADEQFACVQEWGDLRNQGKVVPLWEVIVSRGSATLQQVIDTIGCEDDASNRITFFIDRGDFTREQAMPLVEKWRDLGKKESLFQLLHESGLIEAEKVYIKDLLYYRRGGMRALD